MDDDDELDRIAELPNNGARQRETYARFGLAAYHAQVFENGIVNLIALAEMYAKRSGKPMTTEDVDALHAALYSYTAGRLVNRLAEVLPQQRDLIERYREAVRERNRLMHHFFRDHNEDFMTTLGMQRMVDDADAIRDVLESADRVTTSIIEGILVEMGVPKDSIQAEFDRLLAEARERDDEDNAPD